MSTSYPSNLSDAEWECLQRHLPPLPKRGRPPIHSPLNHFRCDLLRAAHRLSVALSSSKLSTVADSLLPFPAFATRMGPGRSCCERCIGLNANDKEGILTQVQPAWIRHPRENGRGVVWDLWLRCPQAHQRAETASSCGYGSRIPISIYVTAASTHDTRVGSLSARRAHVRACHVSAKMWADAASARAGVS